METRFLLYIHCIFSHYLIKQAYKMQSIYLYFSCIELPRKLSKLLIVIDQKTQSEKNPTPLQNTYDKERSAFCRYKWIILCFFYNATVW